MKRFKNILVIYDAAIDGDDALGQAVAYARENATGLTIAAVLREGQPETLVAVEIQQRLQRLSSGVQHGDHADVSIEILATVDPMRAADDHLKWEDHGPGDIAGITEKFDSSHDAERRVA